MINLRNHSSKVFNVVTAVILTGLCLLLAQLTQINFHKLELPKDKPEFFATGVSASIYESNGEVLYHVVAESAVQFPDDEKISFFNMVFNAYDKQTNKLAQQLFSKDGWIDTESKSAFLGRDVKMLNISSLESRNITLTTHDVNIDTQHKLISTKSMIQANQGQSVLTGIGATFDYDRQFLTIESRVRITYVTN